MSRQKEIWKRKVKKMVAIFLLLCLLLNSSCRLICGIERLPSNEASVKSTHVTSTINCGPPKPFQNNTELKWRPGVRNQSVFLPGEKAVFVCKKGFRQIGWLQTLTCQMNGSWLLRSSSIKDDFRLGDGTHGKYVYLTWLQCYFRSVTHKRLRRTSALVILYFCTEMWNNLHEQFINSIVVV